MWIEIDLDGIKTEGIPLKGTGTTCAQERLPTPAKYGCAAILAAVIAVAYRLEVTAGMPSTTGNGAPGSRSWRTGAIRNANTTRRNARPLAADGASQDHRPILAVILGMGVDGGVVVGGQLRAGHPHITGERRHNTREDDDPPGPCGRRGCIGTRPSGPGLAADHHTHGGHSPAATTTHSRVVCTHPGQALAAVATRAFTGDCVTPLVAAVRGPSSGVREAACLGDESPWPETD